MKRVLRFFLNFLTPQMDYGVDFPTPFTDFTSSDVLVETYADGMLLTTILESISTDQKKEIARIGNIILIIFFHDYKKRIAFIF